MKKEEWIKTSNTRPPFNKPVLGYSPIYGRSIYTYEPIGLFAGIEHGNWHDGKQLGVLPPTHWMNLPEPPIF